MKIITKRIDDALIIPKSISDFMKNSTACVIDIETLGLNRKFHQIVLIGYLYEENNELVIKQLFAEKPDDEKDLLKIFIEDMSMFDTFITYNGNAFDIPFILARLNEQALSWSLDGCIHMDLLLYIRKYQEYLKLDNYKLKTVEELLGINRSDTISGKESVELYKSYTKSKAPELEEKILLHNYEDIYYLSKVFNVFDHLPLKDHSFTSKITITNYIDTPEFFYNPYDFNITDSKLRFSGRTTKLLSLKEALHYHPCFHFKWLPAKGVFEFELSLLTGKLPTKRKYYYVDLNELFIEVEAFKLSLEDASCIHQNFLIVDCQLPGSLIAIIELKKQLLQKLL